MRPPIFLCDELVIEILSWLPVKSLLRFMCVSKSFQSFISDSIFVKLHLDRSPKSTNFLLKYSHDTLNHPFVLPFLICSLSENPLSLIANYHSLEFDLNHDNYAYEVVGSCNGLVCLVAEISTRFLEVFMFRLWNPATRKTFENPQCVLVIPEGDNVAMFGFGYDNLSHTYKVVAVLTPLNLSYEDSSLKSLVCSINDDNGWRNIQSFPANPTTMEGDGVYLNNTLNFLASVHDDNDNSDIAFDELVIVSLHLGNETYKQFLLPRGLDGVYIADFRSNGYNLQSNEAPTIGVLKDCLSLFLHNHKTNHFVLWQMKEFGDQKSWTQLVNIAAQDLQSGCKTHHHLLPLCMLENGRVLMIHNTYHHQLRAVFYSRRDNTVEHSEISNNIIWIYAKDYVQSLVSPT